MTALTGGRRDDDRPVLDSVPRSIQTTAAWSWRFLVIAAATAVVIAIVTSLKTLVVPVAVAVLVAALLHPVVRLLVVHARVPRVLAAVLTLGGLVTLVVGLLTLAGQSLVLGFVQLREQLYQGIEALTEWLSSGPLRLSESDVQTYVVGLRESVEANSDALLSGALSVTTTVGHVVAGTLIALFCAIFFLVDGRGIWVWVVRLLPVSARERTYQASRRGILSLGAYVRTQILVAFVDAVGIGAGAFILGIPLALPLAVLVFLGSFIPIVGAVATGAVAVVIALVDQGPGAAAIMLLIVLAVQQLEGNVLQPFLMGAAVSLHPVAVLLAVAAGSLLAGVVGAVFAVPIAAVLNTVILFLHGEDKFPQLAETTDTFQLRLAERSGPPRRQRVRA